MNKDKAHVGYVWSEEEINYLRENYPTEQKEKLLDMLPDRTWTSIQVRASKMGIRRGNRKLNARSNKRVFQQKQHTRLAELRNEFCQIFWNADEKNVTISDWLVILQFDTMANKQLLQQILVKLDEI